MLNKPEYVCGFAFATGVPKSVVLIKKEKPINQEGLLNGIGGKITPGEGLTFAMSREFLEEVGVHVPNTQWKWFIRIENPKWTVHFFYTHLSLEQERGITDRIGPIKSEEGEVKLYEIDKVKNYAQMTNLKWLIPMCMDPNHVYGYVESKWSNT